MPKKGHGRANHCGAQAVDLPTPGSTAHRAVKLTALLFGVIAYQLNASMVAPAVPEIARRLNSTPGQVAISQTLFFLVGGISGVVLARYPYKPLVERQFAYCTSLQEHSRDAY